jgi:hypothetical protein
VPRNAQNEDAACGGTIERAVRRAAYNFFPSGNENSNEYFPFPVESHEKRAGSRRSQLNREEFVVINEKTTNQLASGGGLQCY